jgi:hypothetical protein
MMFVGTTLMVLVVIFVFVSIHEWERIPMITKFEVVEELIRTIQAIGTIQEFLVAVQGIAVMAQMSELLFTSRH